MKKSTSPTFLLELPLQVNSQQAKHLQGHFEAARNLYNALLGEALKRLTKMRDDSRYGVARTLPKGAERNALFSLLRKDYGFSEYALHAYATKANTAWIAEHIDANTAQTLATRAYQAVNKVCLKKARKVRFKSKGRGIDSLEGKSNKQGIRFVLQAPEEGNIGSLVWGKDRLIALIDWNDPVVCYGLKYRIKFVRLIRRRASSTHAKGADTQGYRYYAQLALEGVPYQKEKHKVGHDIVGLDIGPSTIAFVPQKGEARFDTFCSEILPDAKAKRRVERKLDRQRRANNPDNYDSKGRIKKGRLKWKESHGYKTTRRRLASQSRKLVAHRKSLHGKLVHEIVAQGNTIITEKISYKAWQKQFGRSVGLRAPGMFVELLRRTVATTGGTLHEVSTRRTKLSQFCHGCKTYIKKPLSERWHQCSCDIGPVQRDLYSACLAAYLDLNTFIPSIDPETWEGVEARLRRAIEQSTQRAKEGQVLPRSMGISRARARLSESLESPLQELVSLRGRIKEQGC